MLTSEQKAITIELLGRIHSLEFFCVELLKDTEEYQAGENARCHAKMTQRDHLDMPSTLQTCFVNVGTYVQKLRDTFHQKLEWDEEREPPEDIEERAGDTEYAQILQDGVRNG